MNENNRHTQRRKSHTKRRKQFCKISETKYESESAGFGGNTATKKKFNNNNTQK